MHNRKKTTRAITEAELEALRAKTEGYNRLSAAVLEMRKVAVDRQSALDLTGKMIAMNPDFYSLWNFRREMLCPAVDLRLEVGEASRELTLSTEAIKKNPKSYCAWYHRLWIASKCSVDFERELKLCEEFLTLDQRNFHCWNYRRAVVALAGVSCEVELEFSKKKIDENFSNYSALHHRSVYIRDLLIVNPSEDHEKIQGLLKTELETVTQAVFTEPDDQSAWWYFQFLISTASSSIVDSGGQLAFRDLLRHQIDSIRSLLGMEQNCKWALMSLAFLLQKYIESCATDDSDSTLESEERKSLLLRLCEVDQLHKNRYMYLLALPI